ncbi:MAG: hypothetical protein WBD40_06315 [Tepidisphaeraceae bacterium]
MQQPPLDYQPQVADVETLRWSWDYSRDEWEATLLARAGHEYKLRRDASRGVVFASHADQRWVLSVNDSEAHMHSDVEGALSATLRGREIRFSDDTAVLKDSGGRWCGLTLTEQLRFTSGSDVLLTMAKRFWSKSGRRVRITTTATGAAFPGRAMLVLLGFHAMVVREMNH